MTIRAPFTAEQVDALNRFQRTSWLHPFTCANDHKGDRNLVATQNGWICCNCDYEQNWAHEMMLLKPPVNPSVYPMKPFDPDGETSTQYVARLEAEIARLQSLVASSACI